MSDPTHISLSLKTLFQSFLSLYVSLFFSH